MPINRVFARGDTPHSSATHSELVRGLTRKFEQELSEMVDEVGAEEFTAARFRRLLGDMGSLLAGIGREAITQIVEDRDVAHTSVDVGGQRLRYRGLSEREWLTPFGKITVLRRSYRGDGRGAASVTPLDELCGMQGRHMTPDIEEMAAFGAAMLTANEVEQLLAKVLPQGPSATSIQNAVCRIGVEIEARRDEIEDVIGNECPLSDKGDLLVISWDGVMAPMRQKGGVAWREASVGTVSVYGQTERELNKVDTRFLARMPESGMKSLIANVADQVGRAKKGRRFRDVVAICDGKETIWSAAAPYAELTDATWILDFYHASENLMKAAVAIFGADNPEAARWHEKICAKLQLDERGVDNAIRSMRRYRRSLSDDCAKERNVVKNTINYLRLHRDRMRYAEFLARGLPFGSGPVESAAKNIVQARLKRSGMRWSRDGGQHVLDLRAYLKSERWEPMWSTLLNAA